MDQEEMLHYEEDLYEWDMHKGKGKKAAIHANHLLNFKYSQAPKPTAQRRRRAAPVVPFLKGRFLQANCRFVTFENGDYLANLKDPDLLVDWHDVEQVIFTTWATSTCPICLDGFTAAKVSKCGHVFCWHCIIRHLSYNPSNSLLGKCPICFEMVFSKELKSIAYQKTEHFVEGRKIKFTLLKRSKGSIVPLPRKTWTPNAEMHLSSEDSNMMFAKFTLTSDITNILDREEKELEEAAQEAASSQDDSLPFIMIAMDQLQERRKKFHEIKQQELLQVGEAASNPGLPNHDLGRDNKGKINGNQKEGTKEEEFFYTYQSCDGQQLYLCQLNFKMLLQEYGTCEDLPDFIEGRIVEVEDLTLTEALRKRHKSLSHLPLTSNFQFLEIDLKHQLSKSTQKSFKDEVFRRARRRQEIKRQLEEEHLNEKTLFPFYKNSDLLTAENFPTCEELKGTTQVEEKQETHVEVHEVEQNLQSTPIEPQPIPENPAPHAWNGSTSSSPPSFAAALKTTKHEPVITPDMQKKKSKGGVQYVILSSSGRGRRR